MDFKVYSVKEVAEILKITDVTVRKLLNKGELKGKKVARQWRVTENQLRDYLEGDDELEETQS
ncbi:helix-turn-helix domain-containing protein [Natroniella acetigena]|uniref:helix-turn-helix domain-containing protein n=1 Tax=Natroniella acetigena TaxID=52004 RepID=UPI002009F618|nr:helix-turn-helix domain-containing protein [Natroniella acetigena]MCK8828140.1 helix-turn-helix domain-containing protein [Natroniella acetigena]